MAIAITPVDYETNIPGMFINNVNAKVVDMAPTPLNDLVVDSNVEIQVKLEWDQAGTSPWIDLLLMLSGASWQAKATLQGVGGGASVTQATNVLFSGGAATKSVTVVFPANTLTEGTYQLFLNCHLKAAMGDHLATSFVAQGRAVEIFESAMVP